MFKRNQVEDAIIKLVADPAVDDGAAVRIQLKRLLYTDRANPPGVKPHYAFFGSEGHGRGNDVLFSGYEAFALWLGQRLLAAGFPQARTVGLLRHYRDALTLEHSRMLKMDLEPLFRRSKFLRRGAGSAEIDALVADGRLIVDPRDMSFLAVGLAFKLSGFITRYRKDANGVRRPDGICRSTTELTEFIAAEAYSQRATLAIELRGPCLRLQHWLERTKPAKRGRTRAP